MPANNPHEGHVDKDHGWWAMQDDTELWWLIEKLNAIGPKCVLEIGSAHGGTLFFWSHLVGTNGRVISVDYNPNHGITLDLTQTPAAVDLIHADSHNPETLALIKSEVRQVDFLFIDGDHTYEGAKQDYEMYSPLVRKGGLVAFHDVSYDTEIQVDRFFQEIDRPKEDIRNTHGIGVVYL